MQYRMKTHQLEKGQIEELLTAEQTGALATLNDDGIPYVLPVHFVYMNGHIYIHGLPAGKKWDNIKKRPDVSLSVWHMDCLLLDAEEKPCDTNTAYRSVVIQGRAHIVAEDNKLKSSVLNAIIEKYTPQLSGRPIPEAMLNGTGIIAVEISEMTGKYWE